MRIWQARVVLRLASLAVALAFALSIGLAQRGGQGGGTGGTGGGVSPGKGTPTPTPTPTPTTTPNSTNPSQQQPQIPQNIWLTGRVMMYDGSEPPEPVTIERVCSTTVRPEGYTDSKGHFSINVGQTNNGIFADASTNPFGDLSQPGVFGPNVSSTSMGAASSGPMNQTQYWDCDLRARLPGYRSDTLSLMGRRALDSPDIGVIYLYPIAGIQGLVASATSGQAPKDARKTFEKAMNAVKKNKPDEAEQQLRKAVQIYPRYAEAWYQLGKVLESRNHFPEAREAYASALAADSKYVYPYQQLYQLALKEQNWKDLVDKTDQLLHLDPFEFPQAYYFNALGHLELKEYDAAEKSAEQAVEADRKKTNPKTHYLLGAILIQKQKWIEAAASFRSYLKAAPNASDKAQVEKTLVQLDQQISRVQPATQDSAAQQ